MLRKLSLDLSKLQHALKTFLSLFLEFFNFLLFYLKKKLFNLFSVFEGYKNILVKFFMLKRGRYNRPFLHITAMCFLAVGVIIAPFIADSFPVFSAPSNTLASLASSSNKQSIIVGENVFQTDVSRKPRDKIITYAVEKGDTLSTISKKFGISLETLKWANDLISDDLTIGDELKILPVTGILHKVAKGDSVYSIAKKYDTNPQQIVDFPFNDFADPETFSLVEGQLLIVPDGVKPSEQPYFKKQVYLVRGPVSISSAGFSWPLQGALTQFSSWYHTALDIAAPIGTAIVAARSGTVVKASAGTWDGGYGNNIIVDHGDGFQTLYSHLSTFNVGVGDTVSGGQTVIGAIGMSGRTTGPHLHFEVQKDGVLVNPLPYLQ